MQIKIFTSEVVKMVLHDSNPYSVKGLQYIRLDEEKGIYNHVFNVIDKKKFLFYVLKMNLSYEEILSNDTF